MEFKILNGSEITDEKFDIFYNILKKSFLKEEYRSFEKQKALLNKKIYEILFCSIEGKVAGIMAFWHLEEFVFVEHFAVDEGLRGQGIGSKMLDFIKSNLKTFVILEVELPYNEINRSRIDFYARNGIKFNEFEYYQSPLNEGDKPLALRIMSYPEGLSAKKFKAVRKKLVEAVYKS